MAEVGEEGGVERRRHKRSPSFIKAEMNGQPITILDVSLGGVGGTIELRGDTDILPEPGEDGTVTLLPDDGASITLTVEVVRVDSQAHLFGARIVEMGEEQFDFMRQHFAKRAE